MRGRNIESKKHRTFPLVPHAITLVTFVASLAMYHENILYKPPTSKDHTTWTLLKESMTTAIRLAD